MSKTILKLTETLAVIKLVASANTTETITLAELASPTQELIGDLSVGITHVQWATQTHVTVTRNSTEVLRLYPNTGGFDFGGYGGCTDYTQEDQSIVVDFTGGGTVLLTLRKASGYKSKIEPEYFGQYDNPAVVGS